ncbi:MAG: hypothetical protein ACOZQL_30210 [Myxococcota bacterium]
MGTPDAGCVGITCPVTGGGIGGGGGGGSTGGGGGSTGGGGGSTGGGGGMTTGGGGGSTGGGGGSTGPATTIAAARAATFPAEVDIDGAVVVAVSFAARSNSTGANCTGTTTKGVNANFWLADPNNPQQGVYVDKFRCDGVGTTSGPDYFPQVGDVVHIKGMIGFESAFDDRTAFRVMIKSEYDFLPSGMRPSVCETGSMPACRPLLIEKTGSMVIPNPIDVPITFGGGGAVKAEPAYAGSRIKIAGPLTLANPTPMALKRLSAIPNDDRYFGYELSNGVLVNNFRVFEGARLEDGGVSHCDLRAIALDGGTVTFPNGIIGVWDSYSHAACADGGTDSQCFKNRGIVPGVDAGSIGYTNVLYPTDCADQLQ